MIGTIFSFEIGGSSVQPMMNIDRRIVILLKRINIAKLQRK